MAILNFTDVLRKVGLDPKKVLLIRHALGDEGFRACYDCGKVYEYTCHQKAGFAKGYDYWAIFISEEGTYAKLYALYKVDGAVPDTLDVIPEGIPDCEAEKYQGKNDFYQLTPIDLLREYEGKLIIDWGSSARMWHQRGTTEKPVLAIQANEKKVFTGFENIILSYDELKEIIDDPITYKTWHDVLKAVWAIYLIVDKENGRQYVGSAYGKGGLLGRWSCYVGTYHGNNKEMKELICDYPERYHSFQFSVLQILPKTSKNDVLDMERLYKDKLLSKDFGMNNN